MNSTTIQYTGKNYDEVKSALSPLFKTHLAPAGVWIDYRIGGSNCAFLANGDTLVANWGSVAVESAQKAVA